MVSLILFTRSRTDTQGIFVLSSLYTGNLQELPDLWSKEYKLQVLLPNNQKQRLTPEWNTIKEMSPLINHEIAL